MSQLICERHLNNGSIEISAIVSNPIDRGRDTTWFTQVISYMTKFGVDSDVAASLSVDYVGYRKLKVSFQIKPDRPGVPETIARIWECLSYFGVNVIVDATTRS